MMLSKNTIRRLEERQEELALLFLEQSDTEEWADLTTNEKRGNTYWLKKNAAQTLSIMVRIQSLLNMHTRAGVPSEEDGEPEDSTSQMAREAEADALLIIERVQKSKRK